MSTDEPTAGFYKVRLTRNGPFVPVKIWHGPPLDPVTGEEMDRSWRWQALRNGEEIDIDFVWPWAGRNPISEAEYKRLAATMAWARKVPSAPENQPHEPINKLTATPRF